MRSTRSISKDQTQKLVKLNEQRTYQEEIYEEEGIELRQRSLRQAKFFLEYTQDKGIKYIMDGIVLRDEKQVENSTHSEIMKNLEQVKYLRWEGEFGKNHKKIGKWNAFWRGSNLNVGGHYDQNGQKQGKWIELFPNFNDLCQVTVQGIYKQGLKQSEWTYYLENQQIANGVYNESGQKNGSWIDLHDQYSKENLITFEGKYQNGLKLDQVECIFSN